MSTKLCLCCKQPFVPYPQVQTQAYCSSPACQRERKARWQREKRTSDPDYIENQARAQRAWLDRRPEYWKNYRTKSRERNKQEIGADPTTAKMDASHSTSQPANGLYQINFIEGAPRLSNGGWLAEIQPYARPSSAKKTSAKR